MMPGNFSPQSDNPLLSIVIPVHNQSGYTRSCLDSLAQFPPHVHYEILVVDDCSTDDTPSLLAEAEKRDGRIRSLRNETSRGFAGACNRGASAARGEYLLLLNNDTEALSGWFAPLFDTITANPDIGIVAPLLLFPDGTVQHCGKVWSDLTVRECQPHHIYYRFPSDHSAANKSRDFAMVTGACILVRRPEFLSLGGFDEGYLNGWEDDDLCYKYASSGKRIFYRAESRLIHHQNKTLNERIVDLESRLPSPEKLRELDEILASGVCSEEDLHLARGVRETFRLMEKELEGIRERFRRNRERFFHKWKNCLRRDDTTFCEADNVPLGEALPEIYQHQSMPPDMIENREQPQQGENMPLVSIVILTLNRLDVTRECIDSIRRHTPVDHEIIFVDNGSSDGTVEWLRDLVASDRRYRLMENGTNRGFSVGCNQGISAAKGEYILLLNNDVIVTPEWLEGLLECFASWEVGIAGPMTNNISGIQQWPWARYESVSDLDRFAAEFRARYRHRRVPSRRIVGFCLMFRKELTERIGLLDEQFGSGNFEDDDFCLRSAIAGYRNIIAGDVFIHHVGSATFQGNGMDYQQAMSGNQGLFNEKWSTPVTDPTLTLQIARLKTLEKAEALQRMDESDAAVETLLQDGIRVAKNEPFFFTRIAEIFLEAGMPREALDTLREFPEDSYPVSLLTVRALMECGMPEQARDLMDELETAGIHAPERETLRGELLLTGGDLAAAAKTLEQALAKFPGEARIYAALSDVALRTENRDLALALLEKAVTIAPDDRTFIKRLHALASSEKEIETVERIIAESRHFFPEDAIACHLNTDLLLRRNRPREAMEIIEHSVLHFRPKPGFLEAALQVRAELGPLTIDQERSQRGVAVSLCMIVKNEEANLPRCLASLKPIVDEIIIADTGSSDTTRELARIFGAKVFDVDWTGDYSAARNASLAAAEGNWILVMDADEVISPLDHERFRQVISSSVGKKTAFTVETRNYTNRLDLENWRANRGEYPLEEAGGGWMPSDKVRIFPNIPEIRFKNPIHEMVEPVIAGLGIPDPKIDVPVHHYGYLDDARQRRKGELYYDLGRKKLEESGGAPYAVVELAIQAAGIGRYDEAIELWLRARQIDPRSPLVYFNLGHAYLQKGMFREGKEATLKAMELQDNYREALVNYLMCELCLGNAEECLAAVEPAILKNPDYPMLHLMRGVINGARGAADEALRDFRDLKNSRVDFSRFIREVADKLLMGKRDQWAENLLASCETAGVFPPGHKE